MTKIFALALLGTAILVSPAQANWSDSVFTDLQKTAPRSADQGLGERSYFDQLNDTAPVARPATVTPDSGDGALDSE